MNIQRILELIIGITLGFIFAFITFFIYGFNEKFHIFSFFIAAVFPILFIYIHDYIRNKELPFLNKIKRRSGTVIIILLLLSYFFGVFLPWILRGEKIVDLFMTMINPFIFLFNPFFLIFLWAFWIYYLLFSLMCLYFKITRWVIITPLLAAVVFYIFIMLSMIYLSNIFYTAKPFYFVSFLIIILLFIFIKKLVSFVDSS